MQNFICMGKYDNGTGQTMKTAGELYLHLPFTLSPSLFVAFSVSWQWAQKFNMVSCSG